MLCSRHKNTKNILEGEMLFECLDCGARCAGDRQWIENPMTARFIGTKEIVAWPQDHAQKVMVCGVDCKPGDGKCNGYCQGDAERAPEIAPVAGYAVRYPDGYTSWSPKDVFEAAYRQTEGDDQVLTFGDALHFLKLGERVARKGWNGKGMFIWVGIGSHDFKNEPGLPKPALIGGVKEALFAMGDTDTVTRMPNLNMRAADGSTVVGWLASQTDMLAEDWTVLR